MRDRYLKLLERALTGVIYGDPPCDFWNGGKYRPEARSLGRDWPSLAQTMIGTARMANLRQACENAVLNDIPGDFIETGVWRGGACIFMRGVLEAYGDKHRKVFVADSFMGLPKPSCKQDAGDSHHTFKQLAVSRAEVEDNFRKYDLLDDRVIFLEGWFKDTLPHARIEKISVLRLDGDMYESTMIALESLYHKVSIGGAVIVDDYFLAGCRYAVEQFRFRNRITNEIMPIDGMGVWWVA